MPKGKRFHTSAVYLITKLQSIVGIRNSLVIEGDIMEWKLKRQIDMNIVKIPIYRNILITRLAIIHSYNMIWINSMRLYY